MLSLAEMITRCDRHKRHIKQPERAILHVASSWRLLETALGDHHLAEDVAPGELDQSVHGRPPSQNGRGDDHLVFVESFDDQSLMFTRKQGVRNRALERFEKELPQSPDEEDEKELCKCFRRLLAEAYRLIRIGVH